MYLSTEELSLLEYVYDAVDRDLSKRVDLEGAPFNPAAIDAAWRRLQSAGLLELASGMGDFKITHYGLNFVSELRAKRRNGPARTAKLRLALIHWLYERHLDEDQPGSTEQFLSSNRSQFAGQRFSEHETAKAARYLKSAGLIEGTQVDQIDHLIRPSLTPDGVNCAESEKSVSEFLNSSTPEGGTTFNVRIDRSQNVAVGTQSDFTQNNTSGIDPAILAQLMHFATAARQGVPSYGLDEGQQVEVEQLAGELEAEATGDTPDRGRLRRLTDSLIVALAPAAGSALGGIVTSLGEQAAAAIGS
ncbi:hypothetical protein [Streptomyces cathayae]|uniref:Uncharacterized protein n=1 Tax=Streptomyces cathayae TaxID=3031124 RepID=A0ABY8K1G0_9ACTN|nr:hypothetical protein [Streptomyces sp. HUAS 5]WGD42005.1 hypothetical protein PYS65_18580 [Streptomyces sp. HUAS 5]